MSPDLERRKLLALTGAALSGLAGCTGSNAGSDATTEAETTTEANTTADETETEAEASASGEVTILHDTHFHGHLGSLDEPTNIATYLGLVASRREEKPNALFLGNGDDLHMSVASNVFEGSHIVESLNAAGIDYDTFGNHDFDLGPKSLRANVADSEFTWVTANLRKKGSEGVFAADEGAKPYVLTERDGVTVGVSGLAPDGIENLTSLDGEVTPVDPVEGAREAVSSMREEGADVVVFASHLTNDAAKTVAEEVDGIDAIVGDHAESVEKEPLVVNDTVLSFVGAEFDYLGELTLTVADGEVASHSFTFHDVAKAIEAGDASAHPEVESLVEDYNAELEEKLGVVIGRSEVELDTTRETLGSRESNFANYVADVMREEAGADLALTNGGGIRTDKVYPPGEITRRMIVNVLPFPNKTVTLELSGKTLLEALEHGVADIGGGRFPQVSAIRYTYDPDEEKGSRIVEATVGGEPVDPEATYSVATNDYLSGGGDGYTMLESAPVLRPASEGVLLNVAVMRAIEADGTIAPKTDGRITVA